MKIGLVLPQGYFNEFEGWEPGRAWARIVELAQTAEAANDLTTAVTAYKTFLKLAPEDQSAAAVRQHLKELEQRVSPASSG